MLSPYDVHTYPDEEPAVSTLPPIPPNMSLDRANHGSFAEGRRRRHRETLEERTKTKLVRVSEIAAPHCGRK